MLVLIEFGLFVLPGLGWTEKEIQHTAVVVVEEEDLEKTEQK